MRKVGSINQVQRAAESTAHNTTQDDEHNSITYQAHPNTTTKIATLLHSLLHASYQIPKTLLPRTLLPGTLLPRTPLPRTLLSPVPILTYVPKAASAEPPLQLGNSYREIFEAIFPYFIAESRQAAFESFLQCKLPQISMNLHSTMISTNAVALLLEQQLHEITTISTNSLIDLKFFFLSEVKNLFYQKMQQTRFTAVITLLAATTSSKALPAFFSSTSPPLLAMQIENILAVVAKHGPSLIKTARQSKSHYEKIKKAHIASLTSLVVYRGEKESSLHLYTACHRIDKGSYKRATLLYPLGTLYGCEPKVQCAPIVQKLDYPKKSKILKESQASFQKEASVAQQLLAAGAQNVLSLQAITYGDKTTLLSEYCDLGTLNKYLKVPRPEIQRMKIALEVAKTVAISHSVLQLCHLDLKTANILLKSTYVGIEPRLCDFSTAERFHTSASPCITGIVSTYPAPEMSQQKQAPVAAAQDLWALGIILYQLYYNQTEGEIERLAHDHLGEPLFYEAVEGIYKICAQRGSTTDKMIMRLLAYLPEKRPPAEEVVQAISEYFIEKK